MFKIFMCRIVMGNIRARLKRNGYDWALAVGLFAGDAVLLADNERELWRLVNEFYRVCVRRKLRVNTGKEQGNGI